MSDDADLRERLRVAAVELIAEVGPTAFSLREVARRAGVSHQAPGYHFGDRAGLLTAVALEGFGHLVEALRDRVDVADPVERLVAQGRAYVHVARTHPAHYQVMFRGDLHSAEQMAADGSGLEAFGLLHDTARAVCDDRESSVDPSALALQCWASVHGLVDLDEVMGEVVEAGTADLEDLAEAFTRRLVAGL